MRQNELPHKLFLRYLLFLAVDSQRFQSQNIAGKTQAANLPYAACRRYGFMPEFLTGMNIADMHLNRRNIHCLQGI